MQSDDQINEQFSYASYMGVDEMRHLYYGRPNLFVSFTQDDVVHKKGSTDPVTPYGIVAYHLNDVIARKAKTTELYAAVMRFKESSSKAFVNVSRYNYSSYKKDIDKLYSFNYIEEAEIDFIVSDIEQAQKNQTYFERLWELTRRIAFRRSKSQLVWRYILMDMGYTALNDHRGIGLFAKDGTPSVLILDFENADVVDIMPIQKYKKDPRSYVRKRIKLANKNSWVRRNKIAKYQTPKYRITGIVTKDKLRKQQMGIVT